jgi:hypothetical protein
LLGEENTMTMYCGIDWSERHHDVAVVDHTGTLVAKRRINDGRTDGGSSFGCSPTSATRPTSRSP